MKTLLKLSFSFLLLLIVSCQNSIDESDLNGEVTIEEDCSYSFIYKGVEYSSEYYYAEDSSIVYLDAEVNRISDILAQNKNLITYVNSDGSIEYFDKIEDLPFSLEREENAEIKTRGIELPWYRCIIYCAESYSGSYFTLGDLTDAWQYSSLVRINKNDKANSYKDFSESISSFKMYGYYAYVIFYSAVNYGGYSLLFDTQSTTEKKYLQESKLSRYKLYPNGPNWDNKVKSVTLR